MSLAPLEIVNVTKTFPRGKHKIKALNHLSFTLNAGCITGLLGQDGAGKTTLLRLIAGLLLPSSGDIWVLGKNTRENAQAIQAEIGYMPQHFGLYEELTVAENLNLFAELQGLSPEIREAQKEKLLKFTGLFPFQARRAGALSGGMKQKLGLASVLLRKPQLLILDEPTVGVDPISRRELWQIIVSIKADGGTVLMSTAYFDEAERCDEIILLHEGKLLKKGSPKQFCEPLRGHTFLVEAPHLARRRLQKALSKDPNVQDARIVADGVMVLSKDVKPHQHGEEHWTARNPSFEDAFISLLGKPQSTKEKKVIDYKKVLSAPTKEREAVIKIDHLSKFFGDFQAVKNISFEVRRGEIFGLLGANGAGKTTTFRMLCGLLAPSSGKLSVAEVDMRHAPSAARARIGFVSQKFSLYGNLSIIQNMRFFASAYGIVGKERRKRIREALEEFQLTHYRNVSTEELPLGIKQRLALACALLHEPPILFLDEPTSGVDPLTRREFWQRVNTLAQKKVTILITTHFMDEAEYCDHLVLMSMGEILAQGSPKSIRKKLKDSTHPHPTMEDAFIKLIEQHETGKVST